MATSETFSISDAEIGKTRRGAFLPALLILPIAALFGLDSSKSQPMHFLMTFSIGILFAAAVVSIGWFGAQKRIAEYRKTSLTIADGKLIWRSGIGQSELDLSMVESVARRGGRGDVSVITLTLADGSRKTLEGYDRMRILFERLDGEVRAATFHHN